MSDRAPSTNDLKLLIPSIPRNRASISEPYESSSSRNPLSQLSTSRHAAVSPFQVIIDRRATEEQRTAAIEAVVPEILRLFQGESACQYIPALDLLSLRSPTAKLAVETLQKSSVSDDDRLQAAKKVLMEIMVPNKEIFQLAYALVPQAHGLSPAPRDDEQSNGATSTGDKQELRANTEANVPDETVILQMVHNAVRSYMSTSAERPAVQDDFTTERPAAGVQRTRRTLKKKEKNWRPCVACSGRRKKVRSIWVVLHICTRTLTFYLSCSAFRPPQMISSDASIAWNKRLYAFRE